MEEEGVEETRQGDGQNEQQKPTAASRNYHFHNMIPAWLCTLPNCQDPARVTLGKVTEFS